MGWGYIKSIILWRYDGILYATIYIYPYPHHCIPIYIHGSTHNWMVSFLVRCHVLPSFKGVNYQSIQGWQSCTAVFFFYGFSRNSTEIMVYGEYIYVILCTKNCTAGWFANGGNRQITTGGPTRCTPCFMRCIGLADEWILYDMFVYSDPASSKQYGSKWSKQKPPRTVM